MITKQSLVFKLLMELEDFKYVKAIYNIRYTDVVYIVCTEETVDARMETRMLIGTLEKEYKIKLVIEFVALEDVPDLFKKLAEYDDSILTFGRNLGLDEIYIDSAIRDTVLKLNLAGYKTIYSCSGHGNPKKMYIMFEATKILKYLGDLSRSGIFSAIMDSNLFECEPRLTLRLNNVNTLDNAGVTSNKIMEALERLLIHDNNTYLDSITERCREDLNTSIKQARTKRDTELRNYLGNK
ncbi:hypothetical protein UT300012_24480 [Paraclostridium bifermentans]